MVLLVFPLQIVCKLDPESLGLGSTLKFGRLLRILLQGVTGNSLDPILWLLDWLIRLILFVTV